jgi:hypothetical protein
MRVDIHPLDSVKYLLYRSAKYQPSSTFINPHQPYQPSSTLSTLINLINPHQPYQPHQPLSTSQQSQHVDDQ